MTSHNLSYFSIVVYFLTSLSQINYKLTSATAKLFILHSQGCVIFFFKGLNVCLLHLSDSWQWLSLNLLNHPSCIWGSMRIQLSCSFILIKHWHYLVDGCVLLSQLINALRGKARGIGGCGSFDFNQILQCFSETLNLIHEWHIGERTRGWERWGFLAWKCAYLRWWATLIYSQVEVGKLV